MPIKGVTALLSSDRKTTPEYESVKCLVEVFKM